MNLSFASKSEAVSSSRKELAIKALNTGTYTRYQPRGWRTPNAVWGKKRHTERRLGTHLVTNPTAFVSTSVLGSVLLIHA